MITSIASRCADMQLVSFARLHARAFACVLALSGVTVVLLRTEPWQLCFLAVVGLVMLPVMLQNSFLVHETTMNKHIAVDVVREDAPKAKNNQIQQELIHAGQQVMPELDQPAKHLIEHPAAPLLPPIVDPSHTISLPPIQFPTGRKGIMPKNVLQIREEMFAKAMGSLRSLSPRNQPVVHHLDLIKYAEEIEDDDPTVL
ncbi:hypothetical protein AC1031_007596 [Aphanomyces cochlioides]|nr:hypothetical protein AC1031_007596 [Aphanomyces cochlioides]